MKKSVLLLICCAVLFSCENNFKSSCVFDQTAFYENKSKWEELNLQDYSFEYEITTYMPFPLYKVSSEVKNGNGSVKFYEIDSENYIETEPIENYSYGTISRLFDFIEKRYKDDKADFDNSMYANINYEISYDETYGYPVSVSLFSCFDYIEIENNVWVAPVGINPLVIEIKNFQN